MAILSADGTYVTVQRGDNLWSISRDYYGGGSNYIKLAQLNGIPNPNLIYANQKIYLNKGATSSSSSKSSSSSSNKPIVQMGLQSNADNTLLATWTWGWSNTASYEILWSYETGDGVWLIGNNSSITVNDDYPELAKVSTYQIPANARTVKFKVKPVSKIKDEKNKTYYWTNAQWSSEQKWTDSTPLTTPSAPSVTIENYKLTAKLENLKIPDATHICFQVYKNDSTNPFAKGDVKISSTSSVTYTCDVEAGGEYKVRCRTTKNNTMYSDWSEFSSGISTMPVPPTGITVCKATSETSVYLEWSVGSNTTAKTFDIEYTTKKTYFDGSDQTTTVSSIEFTHYEISGLETGTEYFFRVRAVNGQGNSKWTDIVSVVIGKDPAAPTTWSSTTTVVTGEPLTLYWVHNAEDGSSQTYSELELYIDGVKETHTVTNSTNEDEKNKTSSFVIDTSVYVEGTTIQWRVRTAGVTKTYGDWSIQRVINVYAPPTLELNVTDMSVNILERLTTFPFYVSALAGPKTQVPTGYHLTVIANESYETTDQIGTAKTIKAGDQVYSRYFDTSDALLVEMSAGNIDLCNNISYTVTCIVSMNSGLTAEASSTFTVAWTDESYSPNAEIGVDSDTLAAYIRPYCEETSTKLHVVDRKTNTYTITVETLEDTDVSFLYTTTGEQVLLGVDNNGIEYYYGMVWGEDGLTPTYNKINYRSGAYTITSTVLNPSTIKMVYTTTGEQVHWGVTSAGVELYFCEKTDASLIEGITLAVYRREYDGTFVEIGSGLRNTDRTVVVDPHPALDYARYRVVATTDSSGAVSYSDLSGYPIQEKSIIIQWDEAWTNFNVTEDSELVQPPWSGSLLKLPYNIDVSESTTLDVTHVEYVGRRHPVSYHGTHVGEKGNWSTEIPATDVETLYALRRLKSWMGDVYVREPSGIGYWATISVSFSQTHCESTIPVSIDVTRVEGGV